MGELVNPGPGGYTGSATVNGGRLVSGGTIHEAEVNAGTLRNTFTYYAGTLTLAHIGTVDTATVRGGVFDNIGITTELMLHGGTFNNITSPVDYFVLNGIVNTATLLGGVYTGVAGSYTGDLFVGGGGTLDSGLYLGKIDDLSFGNGGVLVLQEDSLVNILGTVNLAGALLDTSAIDDFVLNNLASYFNFAEGAGFVGEYNFVLNEDGRYSVTAANSTPEPATLLLVGLGLAGLGLARRKK
ncbi:hypothetical protein FACS189419_01640 [Planctomycetales bacterium]|nr:hypothetical protein FACS189419_01640 [Planctomycetales bacterium]